MKAHRIRQSAWFNILWPVFATLVLNGLIFGFGWNNSSASFSAIEPPGWFVGVVWVVWFALMGYARWVLVRVDNHKAKLARRWILALIAFCWIYPFYTLALDSQMGGLIGNIATIMLTIYVFYRLWPINHKAAWLIFPIIPWVIYASFTILLSFNGN